MKDKCARCGVEFNEGITVTSTPTTHVGLLDCIAALRAELDRMKSWIIGDCTCPCCTGDSACLDGCTFETDCPEDWERMTEARAVLAAEQEERK